LHRARHGMRWCTIAAILYCAPYAIGFIKEQIADVCILLFVAMSLTERLSQPTVDEAKRNGIPAALFIEDVSEFLVRERQSPEEAIYFLQDLHRKYKFLERRLLANKGQLKGKIPDILQSLDAVRLLKSSQDSEEGLVSNFQLCESLYATARIKKQQHIGLWLGANVMMEYTLDEAEELLTSNLATAQASLVEVDTGLSFCREQLTTTEVNIARVYNYDVQLRRQVSHNNLCHFSARTNDPLAGKSIAAVQFVLWY
jgi:prefoldin subunit 5